MLGFVSVALALAGESQALVAPRGFGAAPRRACSVAAVDRRFWLRVAASVPAALVVAAPRPSGAAGDYKDTLRDGWSASGGAKAPAPVATAIAGVWTLQQDVRFEGVPKRAEVAFLKSGDVSVKSEGAVAMSSEDFIIEPKRGSRMVKWQTDYDAATLVYEGVVEDAVPGEMTGTIFELSDKGGAGTKAGTFLLKQVNSVEPKASVLFAKPTNLKPGDDLGGKERWVFEKEKAQAAAKAETAAVREKNEALMQRLGCSDQASCVEKLKAEAAR
ncbi:hypothetical protein M885DRAFT_626471 [Pelagophyceae sp. CCMP2097]|nr:hypothetical protein M885DRAFT_626471 [Pelagophyceae sp. CCMP2097]